MHSIITENICKSYIEVKAIDQFNIEVEKGELFGLIGPDGAGKTTLIRILATLILASKGNAFVSGLDVVKNYQKIRDIIGYMPGRFALYQDLTVEENLNLYASIFGTTVKENYHLIEGIYSQIEPFKKRRAGKLSGGMKQKLALSCALIHKPEVLFLDEPTTGVDPVSRKEFWEMLKKLKEQNITILVSTPYMDEAALCERVALMQNGTIMSINTPENIIKNFDKEIYSISSANTYKTIQFLNTYKNTFSAHIFGDSIHYIDLRMNIDLNTLINELIEKDNSILFVTKTKPGIEDCFMDLMVKNNE